MPYSISTIQEIDEDEVEALKSVGIKTTEKLLEAAATPLGRKHLAARSRLDPKKLLRWANMADKLRIKGMGNDYASLLRRGRRGYGEGAGIPQPAPACPIHAGGQQEAEAGPVSASREAGDALDRAGAKASEEDHILIARRLPMSALMVDRLLAVVAAPPPNAAGHASPPAQRCRRSN